MMSDSPKGRKLRLGLFLDSFLLQAWTFTAIERIACSDYAEVALVILKQPRLIADSTSAVSWDSRCNWAYRLFNAIDERLFLRGPNALALRDASELLSAATVLSVTLIGEGDAQSFSSEDIDQIKSYDLDILVKLGFETLDNDILTAAAYGVWAYGQGLRPQTEAGLTGFWEVIDGFPETSFGLQVLNPNGGQGEILCESRYFTYPFSPARSRNYILWSASSLLPRQIERLYRHRHGESYQKDEASNYTVKFPSSIDMIQAAGRLLARNLNEIYRRNFLLEQWGLLSGPAGEAEKSTSDFRKIFPSKDRFWADPHLVHRESHYYLFVEEYLYQTGKGHLSVIEMDEKGGFKQPVPILKKDYHLSYPSVFEWRGRYYMVPETSENRTIDLYSCAEFPYQWRFEKTLMKNVVAVDTTLFFDQEKWWLFTAMAENEGAFPQVELFLFYSDQLLSDRWQPHPMNPIISDVRNARPAGRIFTKDGAIFRPAQYGSSRYGFGYNLNQILELSPSSYLEKQVSSMKPDWDPDIQATHTYWSDGKLTVIDALTIRRKF
jgi:hypothetical protein